MKNIEPIKIWNNGEIKEVTVLEVAIIYDNLNSNCTFYYELKSESEDIGLLSNKVAYGNIQLSGEEYLNWDGSNDFAFIYVAEQLNLVLV